MDIVGNCKGHPDVRHTDSDGKKCGGQLAISGTGQYKLPLGFGYRGNKFVVDQAKYECYTGFCMKCGKEGIFVRTDVKAKAVTKRLKKYDVKF